MTLEFLTIQGLSLTALFFLLKEFIPKAIQHDFDARLEQMKPLTAEETLKRENFLNSKRDAYFEAVGLVYRNLACSTWSLEDPTIRRSKDADYPREEEVNMAIAKLAMFTSDPKIPKQFANLFPGGGRKVEIPDIARFVNNLRSDLGYGDTGIPEQEYIYAFIGKKDGSTSNTSLPDNRNTAGRFPMNKCATFSVPSGTAISKLRHLRQDEWHTTEKIVWSGPEGGSPSVQGLLLKTDAQPFDILLEDGRLSEQYILLPEGTSITLEEDTFVPCIFIEKKKD